MHFKSPSALFLHGPFGMESITCERLRVFATAALRSEPKVVHQPPLSGV